MDRGGRGGLGGRDESCPYGGDDFTINVNHLDTLQLYIVHCAFYIDNVVGGVRVEGDTIEEVAVNTAVGSRGDENFRPVAEVVLGTNSLHSDFIIFVVYQPVN